MIRQLRLGFVFFYFYNMQNWNNRGSKYHFLKNVSRESFSYGLSIKWQVWDATTGQKQYIFEGHEAPVYSVCPHYKEAIQVNFPAKDVNFLE